MSIFTQQYLSAHTASDVGNLLNQDGVLAIVGYTGDCSAPATLGLIPSGLTSLNDVRYEVIRYPFGRAERGQENGCQWSRIGDLLCVATWITPAECENMEESTEQAYNRLLNLARSFGHPHPFRIWNLLPRINYGDGDQEVYKKFCNGRMHAFTRYGMVATQYPAASALGHHTDGAVIYMLAAKEPSRNLENSRQVPAYTYPRQYGPCSPSFARATRLNMADEEYLFVSGTASILGHSTHAPGDFLVQLQVTQENIAHLVAQANGSLSKMSALRVYLRHPEHLQPARDMLEKIYAPEHLNFVYADICREQLLVEIEALVEL